MNSWCHTEQYASGKKQFFNVLSLFQPSAILYFGNVGARALKTIRRTDMLLSMKRSLLLVHEDTVPLIIFGAIPVMYNLVLKNVVEVSGVCAVRLYER